MSERDRTMKRREIRKKLREKKKQGFNRKIKYGIVAIAIILGCCILFYLFSPSTNDTYPFSYKVAIVDHLSLSQPNQTFKETATNMLENAGLTVDYYKGEEVTVGFYKNLPRHNYGLIILRVHSASGESIGKPESLILFTSEKYSKTKHVYEQLTDKVVPVKLHKGGDVYFGIFQDFVRSNMEGRFGNTTIIMMGCGGLFTTKMAEAFVDKGAKVYIGWTGPVSAEYVDRATVCLLQNLIIRKQTIFHALIETMKEVGPDPEYESVLLFYPVEAGESFWFTSNHQ